MMKVEQWTLHSAFELEELVKHRWILPREWIKKSSFAAAQHQSEISWAASASHPDSVHGLLRLLHAGALRGRPLRQQVGAAQVGGRKDDAVNEVLRVTRSRDYMDQTHSLDTHTHTKTQVIIHLRVSRLKTGAEKVISLHAFTHRPQMLGTEEEICESEEAQSGKTKPTSWLFLSFLI